MERIHYHLREPMTLGELYGQITPGNSAGRCVLCHKTTVNGHAIRDAFSEKFTQYAVLSAGNVVCEFCISLIRAPELRRRSWVMTTKGVEFLSRAEIEALLIEPPPPPFAVYITRGGQRQGWLSLVNRVSTTREVFYVGTDWTDYAVLTSSARQREFIAFAQSLLKRGVKRSVLLGERELPPLIVHKAIRENWLDELEKVRNLKGNPEWEIAVTVAQVGDNDD